MRSMEGMSILVTGGGSGIGADCARRFCDQGARVTISGRRLDKLEEVQQQIGEQCHLIQGDVTREEDRERMLQASVAHGAGRLDALVNNAANMYRQPVDQNSETLLREDYDTNVISAMMHS
ncbi:MAG: SDR family oxidoreductase, partial [Halieaceae bacterium]